MNSAIGRTLQHQAASGLSRQLVLPWLQRRRKSKTQTENGGRLFHALQAQRKSASYEVAGKVDEEIILPGRDDGKIRRRWTPTEGASSASRF